MIFFNVYAYLPHLLVALLLGSPLAAQEAIPYGTSTLSDCSPKLTFSVTHTECEGNSGAITFTIADFATRTNVLYSVDNGISTVNRSTAAGAYTFSNLTPGNYQIFAIWGNGDCPTLYGSIQVYGYCDDACTDFPTVKIDREEVGCEPATGSVTFNVSDFGERESVRFSIDGGTTYETHNLADGDYTISGLTTGPYALRADWAEGECSLNLGSLNIVENCIVIETCEGTSISKNGLVIIEVEATSSPYDQWILKTDVDGYTGEGHLEFTGNNQASGPPMSPLDYTFTINQGGLYRLIIKSRKRLEGQPSDRSNDGYVRLRGNFGEGPNAGDNHKDQARLADLRRNVKFFGGNPNSWGWAQQLDLGGHENKRQAVYDLRAGETYTFTLSGRSKNYNADKIVFYRMEDYSLDEAKNVAFSAGETCDSATSVRLNQRMVSPITYPDPVLNMLYWTTQKPAQAASIYDGTGRKVLQRSGADAALEVSSLPPGVYYLRLDDGPLTKFIKQ